MIKWLKPGSDLNPDLYLAGWLSLPTFVVFRIPLYVPRVVISRTLMKGDMDLLSVPICFQLFPA